MRKLNSASLVLVLAAIILIVGLAAIGLNFTLNNYSLCAYNIDGTKAFYFAEAGVRRAMYKIKINDFVSPETWEFAGQNIDITIAAVTGEADTYSITSRATFGSTNATKQVNATVLKIPEGVRLSKWQLIN
jgi:Tfp pilus assembly protein PilX